MAEKQVPLPLDGDEVKGAILFRISEALDKSCHLSRTNAYTKFKSKIRIENELDDYGQLRRDNHIAEVSGDSGARPVLPTFSEMMANANEYCVLLRSALTYTAYSLAITEEELFNVIRDAALIPVPLVTNEVIEFTMEPEPPNVVRRDTNQDVPIKTTEDGKTVIRKVKYQSRKTK